MAMAPILRAAVHLCCVSFARGSASFVPSASAVATAPVLRDVTPPSGFSSRASLAPTSLASSTNGRGGDRKKHARTYIARIPRHPEEAAGITGGLGLWGDVRRRVRKRRRRLVDAKWKALRSRRSGRRRQKLALRFQKHVLRNKPPPLPGGRGGEEFLDDSAEGEDEDDEEEDLSSTSLDAMRARAGVIRTRIRLRQESLSNLERLKTDVRLEMKRTGWKNIFNADAGYTNRTVFMYGQSSGKEELDGKDTIAVMNEFELAAINEKWERRIKSGIQVNGHASRGDQENKIDERDHNTDQGEPTNLMEELQVDRLERRALKLRNSILLDRIRLQRLERRILCFESNELGILERAVGNTLESLNDLDLLESNPTTALRRQTTKFVNTFGESTSVLLRKLQRVRSRSGPDNRGYSSVTDFAVREAAAGVRIVGGLLSNPSQLSQLVDPDTPTLVPHVPAILARLDRLESHVAPILNRVLNNKRHLRSIEPYLDEILERFDDIEPHLPWILGETHVVRLAKNIGICLSCLLTSLSKCYIANVTPKTTLIHWHLTLGCY